MPSPWNARFVRDNPPRSPFSTPFPPQIPGLTNPGQPNEAFKNPIHAGSGTVIAILANPRAASIWVTVELPILLQKGADIFTVNLK